MKINIPAGKFAGEDAAAKRRREIRERLGKGETVKIAKGGNAMAKDGEATGIPADVTFMCAAGASYTGSVRDNYGVNIPVEALKEVQDRDGVVHNEKRERDYWREGGTFFGPNNGSRPGQYSNDEIKQIMDYRSQNDFYKDFKY